MNPESQPGPNELDLIRGLAEALDEEQPIALLEAASALAAVSSAAPSHPLSNEEPPLVTTGQLTESFIEIGLRETDALLRVWAAASADEVLERRILQAVDKRDHPVPQWLHETSDIRPVRVVSVGHILGDAETLFVDVHVPAGSLTLAVAIEHAGSPAVEDAYLIPYDFAQTLRQLERAPLDGTTRTELSLADTRARIEEALSVTMMTWPPYETETWPETRPFLEWMTRLMPEDGTGFERHKWTRKEISKLATGFEKSKWASGIPADALNHAELLFEFQAVYGTGDPLRWSNAFVERLMLDLYPRIVEAPIEYLEKMPRALRALVAYAHERVDVPQQFTDETIEAVDEFEDQYVALINDPSEGRFGDAMDERFDTGSIEAILIEHLEFEVGGEEALENLADDPLPAEALDAASIPESVRERAVRISDLVDEIGVPFFGGDLELRTVARRLLARVAAADPSILQRRSSDAGAAAALCWIAGKLNQWFTSEGDKSRTVKHLTEVFGLKSSPAQRAETMLYALDPDALEFGAADVFLGDASLLTSTRRAEIIRDRDDLVEGLDDEYE